MRLIPLTQGKFAKVSDHRFDFLNQWKWFCDSKGYAVRNSRKDESEKRTLILMHRVINNTPDGMETDHRDIDPLNNQDDNLRTVTRAQNQFNRKPTKNSSSKYKGVAWHKHAKKWIARIRVNKKLYNLGYFDIEIEAAKRYDKEALKYFGEFAKLNFN